MSDTKREQGLSDPIGTTVIKTPPKKADKTRLRGVAPQGTEIQSVPLNCGQIMV